MSVGAAAPHRVEHAGQILLFCSARCLEKFRSHPGALELMAVLPAAHQIPLRSNYLRVTIGR